MYTMHIHVHVLKIDYITAKARKQLNTRLDEKAEVSHISGVWPSFLTIELVCIYMYM